MSKQVFALNWKEFAGCFIIATIFNKLVLDIGNADVVRANLICFSFLGIVFILRKLFDRWIGEHND